MGPKYVNIVQQAQAGTLEGGTNYFGYHTPDAPGFVFLYDDANGWNPDIITPELLEDLQTDVAEKYIAEPIHTYTTEDAAGGTF